MAISFSRPDPSSPSAVSGASFPTSRRGFDQEEVRDFLRMVAAELGRLQERERFLESELKAMQTRGLSGPGRLDEETVTALLGEEAARVLTTAREASITIRERAEESATRLVKEATEDASRIREAAHSDAQRIRDDAAADANSEVEMAKQQGRDMVNEARAYREKVLSELSRRRDAARAQIEQLLHGRDRLMSAFERARIATESVLGELHGAHDEPETLVNLSPTTGPIPVVNPHHPSVGAYDQEAEHELASAAAAAEELVERSTATIDIPLESILEADEPASADSGQVLEVQTEAEVHDLPVVVADEPAYEETVEVPEDVIIETVTEVSAVEPAGELDHESAEPVAPATNVVSLFDRRPHAVPDLPRDDSHPSTEDAHPPREKAPVRADHTVDDIFAKLRESSTEQVAKPAQTAAKSDDAKQKKAGPAAAKPAAKKKPAVVAADPKVFAARDKAVEPLVAQAARKLKRALADEQNGVLEHLRNKRASLEIDAVLGTVKEHAARYAAVVGDESMTAASAGVKSVRGAGATPKRVTRKAIDTAVAKAVAEGLVAAFREDARVALGEAEGDRSLAAGLMRDVYRKWKMSGIDEHAADTVHAAHNAGAYLSLDPSATVAWTVDPANDCCPDCADNALAGAIVKGGEFPTGHTHPMAHAGCRCLITPTDR
ncbi:MAG: DivIVA domain-containing protein [Ilumatobacteraceae bacterium]